MSEQEDDLEINYFKQHEKAKSALETFSCYLKNIHFQYQNLLHENIVLSITNEKLKKSIKILESNKQVFGVFKSQPSETLEPSSDYESQIPAKIIDIKAKNNLHNESSSLIGKENTDTCNPRCSSDLELNIGNESQSFSMLLKATSELESAENLPLKIQNSPILSKRKKTKISKNKNSYDKNTDNDHDSGNTFELKSESESSKVIDKILQSPTLLCRSKNYYADVKALHQEKKIEQTTLNFEIPATVMDDNKENLGQNFVNESKSDTFSININDETCFSQDELLEYNKTKMNVFKVNSVEPDDDETQFEGVPDKKMLLNSFDVIPGRIEKSPNYPYKEGPIRKKDEKDKLPGWSCRDCEEYYKRFPKAERKKRQDMCSKHRGKYKPEVLTPESFWNPVFSETSRFSNF